MGVFVNSIQNQAQSICTSIEDIRNKQNGSIDWIRGKIEAAHDNLAALNGTLIKYYREFYKKKAWGEKREE
jgi:hypothetical protein